MSKVLNLIKDSCNSPFSVSSNPENTRFKRFPYCAYACESISRPCSVTSRQHTRASCPEDLLETYPFMTRRLTIRVAPLLVNPRECPTCCTGQSAIRDMPSKARNSAMPRSWQHEPSRPFGPKLHAMSNKLRLNTLRSTSFIPDFMVFCLLSLFQAEYARASCATLTLLVDDVN